MAKKGQPAQLQIEVNNDEEWEKLMQRDGLIVVDVYSDWCGPCLGMQANLKKIKLEFGGDILQLAMAKSDHITPLERFKNKSEPTWMFISKGKMVALMFGADAPKLRILILEELKKEQAQMEGQPTDRNPVDVTELAEEERIRHDALESKQKEIKAKEEAKKAKELLERRTTECENILINLPNFGAVLIFPSAKETYKGVLHDILDEAGLNLNQTEKIHFDENMIKELCFFTEVAHEFADDALEELLNNESFMLLLKVSARAEIPDIDDALLTLIYGPSKHPPGGPESVAHKLITEIEETEEQAKQDQVGIWVPPKPQVRATVLRMFFPKVSMDFTIPEPPPEPEHLAIIYPLSKKDEVWAVINQYPNELMKYGIFTSGDPEDAKLVSKTFKKLDKMDPKDRTFEEKMVFQVSKKRSEAILQFAQLDPLYMSPNAKEGKNECQTFFPDEYEPETEDQEEELEAGEEGTEDEEGEDGEKPEGEEGEITERAEGEVAESEEVMETDGDVTPTGSSGVTETPSVTHEDHPEG